MNSQIFKTMFSDTAHNYGFKKAYGGWFKESSECIVVIELQKSNFGNYFQMNIKIFIQGLFGKVYSINEILVKKEIGHIRGGEPNQYRNTLNLEEKIDDNIRKEQLESLFQNYIESFTNKALSKSGINSLVEDGEILLLPAIKLELTKFDGY